MNAHFGRTPEERRENAWDLIDSFPDPPRPALPAKITPRPPKETRFTDPDGTGNHALRGFGDGDECAILVFQWQIDEEGEDLYVGEVWETQNGDLYLGYTSIRDGVAMWEVHPVLISAWKYDELRRLFKSREKSVQGC